MNDHQTARLKARISGRVQGVGFRQHTVSRAASLGVTGWVRNNPDGSVDVVAEGLRDQLDILLTWLHEGPTAARVQSVDADWSDASGAFETFTVRH